MAGRSADHDDEHFTGRCPTCGQSCTCETEQFKAGRASMKAEALATAGASGFGARVILVGDVEAIEP